MVGNGWKRLEMNKMAGNGWTWLEIVENGLNGWKWLENAGSSWKIAGTS